MARLRWPWCVLALAALSIDLVACVSPKTEGRECVFSRDCTQGLICAGGMCRIECADERDCMLPNVCRASGEASRRACLPPDSPQPCATNADCPSTAQCAEKYCRWTCSDDARCAELRAGTCDSQRGTCSLGVRAGDRAPVEADAGVDAGADGSADVMLAEASMDAASSMDVAVEASVDGSLVCAAGRGDCDRDPSNGCEVDLNTDPDHCGSCDGFCNPPANATRACVAGACAVGTCATGFGDCDRGLANGCEAVLDGNREHCGRCGNTCMYGTYCGPFMGRFACQSSGLPAGDAGATFVPDSGLVVSDAGGDAGSLVTTLAAGRHEFVSVTIPANAEIRSASGVLEIIADGVVRIDGTIDVSGGRGGDAPPSRVANADCRPSGQGGGTGTRVDGITSVNSMCPPASLGGAGAEGSPAPVAIMGCSLGGAFGGGNGAAGTPAGAYTAGGGGGGFAGGGGGGVRAGTTRGGSGASVGGSTGGLGGSTSDAGAMGLGGEYSAPMSLAMYAGSSGAADTVALSSGVGGGGGGSIGLDAAQDLAVATTFRPGSGGGGGSFASCTADQGGGAGGGGGGGALRIVSNTAIVLGPTARLLAAGGNGGSGSVGSTGRSGGGGGSGGVIVLSAPRVEVDRTAVIDVRGGAGGRGYNSSAGGAGGLGRVRIAVLPGYCRLDGAFQPGFATGNPCEPSAPSGTPGRVFVGSFPP